MRQLCLLGGALVSHMLHADWEATDDFDPEDTDSVEDFKKTQFLDLQQPLLWQMWQANFRFANTQLEWAYELIRLVSLAASRIT